MNESVLLLEQALCSHEHDDGFESRAFDPLKSGYFASHIFTTFSLPLAWVIFWADSFLPTHLHVNNVYLVNF